MNKQRWPLVGGLALAVAALPLTVAEPGAAAEPVAGGGDAPVAEPAAAEAGRVTIEFKDTPVREAMQRLSQEAGIDFAVAPAVEGSVTAKFVDQPLERVVRLIAVALGVSVEQVGDVFVLKPAGSSATAAPPLTAPGTAAARGATAAATGAGSLLPGQAPTTPLREAGTPPLTGGVGEQPAAQPRVREEIPVYNQRAGAVAGMVGGVDAGQPTWGMPQRPWTGPYPGVANGAGAPYGGIDPYQNLPPEARVTPNGTILLPNGTTILPSGVMIGPDGTVYQTQRYPTHYSVPWGTQPNWSQPQQTYQNQGALRGNVGGWGFQMGGANGGLNVQPPAINFGGGVSMQLPGMQVGGQTQQTYPGWPAYGYAGPNQPSGVLGGQIGVQGYGMVTPNGVVPYNGQNYWQQLNPYGAYGYPGGVQVYPNAPDPKAPLGSALDPNEP